MLMTSVSISSRRTAFKKNFVIPDFSEYSQSYSITYICPATLWNQSDKHKTNRIADKVQKPADNLKSKQKLALEIRNPTEKISAQQPADGKCSVGPMVMGDPSI